MVAWSWLAWGVSVAAVLLSGAVAAVEGHWRRSPRLDIGFATHGGMWGDLLLLSAVNALVAPWIRPGTWLLWATGVGALASIGLHAWWHGGHAGGLREHMWPTRSTGHWRRDLSWAGWCHVAYVAGEVTLLAAFVMTPMPTSVVLLVSALLTLHVPLGVLAPAWTATGRVFREDVWQTAAAITAVWVVAVGKLPGF